MEAFASVPVVGALSFRSAVLLYPLVTAAHVLEEWRGFPRWAQRFASPRYSRREYVITHAAALVIATASALLARTFPTSWCALLFFGLAFGPSIACNALFHIGSSLVTRTYCPGVVTSVTLYLPATITVGAAALREGLLHPGTLTAAMTFAAVFHLLEVGHNVFKRW